MSENLSQYVERVMRQKGLGLRDVERNSGKRVTNSHLSKILKGEVTNLTADKIMALAQGLDVDPHEVFAAIAGQPAMAGARLDAMTLASIVQQVANQPRLVDVIRRWLQLSPEEQDLMTQSLELLAGAEDSPAQMARRARRRKR